MMKIISAIRKNNMITRQELAKQIGFTIKGVDYKKQ